MSPTPDKAYSLKLVKKFGLTEVKLNDDLRTIYDRDYLVYLRYGLADFYVIFITIPFQPKKYKKDRRIYYKIN